MYQILSSPKYSIRPCADCPHLQGRWCPIANRFLCEACTAAVAKDKRVEGPT